MGGKSAEIAGKGKYNFPGVPNNYQDFLEHQLKKKSAGETARSLSREKREQLMHDIFQENFLTGKKARYLAKEAKTMLQISGKGSTMKLAKPYKEFQVPLMEKGDEVEILGRYITHGHTDEFYLKIKFIYEGKEYTGYLPARDLAPIETKKSKKESPEKKKSSRITEYLIPEAKDLPPQDSPIKRYRVAVASPVVVLPSTPPEVSSTPPSEEPELPSTLPKGPPETPLITLPPSTPPSPSTPPAVPSPSPSTPPPAPPTPSSPPSSPPPPSSSLASTPVGPKDTPDKLFDYQIKFLDGMSSELIQALNDTKNITSNSYGSRSSRFVIRETDGISAGGTNVPFDYLCQSSNLKWDLRDGTFSKVTITKITYDTILEKITLNFRDGHNTHTVIYGK